MNNRRSESRRDKREDRKLDKQVQDGVTRRQLLEAEAELAGGVDEAASPETTFGVYLYDWVVVEHRRETIRIQYQRATALKGKGRKNDPDQSLTQYVQVKEEQQIIEEQMVAFLQALDDDELRPLLHTPHHIPGEGITLRVPEKLSDLIEAALYPEDDYKEEEIKEVEPEPVGKAKESVTTGEPSNDES